MQTFLATLNVASTHALERAILALFARGNLTSAQREIMVAIEEELVRRAS